MPDLNADCSACAALCCVALAFDKGPRFAIDKPAGQPCPNLSGHLCNIHESLDNQGFPGCLAYDCLGAGQRTIALYEGQSWRDDAALLPRQMETFAHLRALHEVIELLTLAASLPLSATEDATRAELLDQLSCPLTIREAAVLAGGPLPGLARAFLRSLAPQAAAHQ